MSLNLKLISIVFCLFIMFVVLIIVKKGRISIKYSLIWFVSFLILLLLVIVPELLTWITNLMGIQTASNLVFALLIALLVFINLSLTIIVSGQNEKIRLLIQEVSILKEQNSNVKR